MIIHEMKLERCFESFFLPHKNFYSSFFVFKILQFFMNAKEEEIFQVAESCMEEMHDKKCFHAEILLSQGNNNQILVKTKIATMKCSYY